MPSPTLPTAPVADKISHAQTQHTITRQDPYHWLRAENWQEVMRKPDTLPLPIRKYLEAENDYFTVSFGDKTKDLQDTIYREIRGRIKEDESGIPSPDGPFAYYSKMLEGKQYPLLMRTARNGENETCILDCNKEAGEEYFGFAGAAHDPEHRLLAWGCDRNGSEYYTIRIRNLSSDKDLPDLIEKSAGGAVWAADSLSIYYVELDENHRPFRVRQHVLGTRQTNDKTIYEENDPGFFVQVGKTLSGKYITISTGDHQTSEIRLIDARLGGKPILIAPRLEGREYSVDERHGELIILTNERGAKDFK
ncbi:MAG: S9 family peptidase, partial [Devosiaceae bacterium]|nr:S9 family peptidase [Devosiaceae bacterium]